MNNKKLCVYFKREAPRIGCGWRMVEVISRGPKWVRVRYAPLAIRGPGCRRVSKNRQPVMIACCRIPADVWSAMEGRAAK